jgi:hypothetical protein
MMTLEEIRSSQINPNVAREAYNQADKRLTDVLETKKSFEQKAFTLFGVYVTAATALFGVGGAILKDNYWNYLSTPFFWTAGMFVAGAIFFILALMDKTYGALASDPEMWLNKGTIDGEDGMVSLMLAYITYYHKQRIQKSTEANYSKAFKSYCVRNS